MTADEVRLDFDISYVDIVSLMLFEKRNGDKRDGIDAASNRGGAGDGRMHTSTDFEIW